MSVLVFGYVVWALLRGAEEREMADRLGRFGIRLQRMPGPVRSLFLPGGPYLHLRRKYIAWHPTEPSPLLDTVSWLSVVGFAKDVRERGNAESADTFARFAARLDRVGGASEAVPAAKDRPAAERPLAPQEPPPPAEPNAHAAIVTPEMLARLVRIGQEQRLNRQANWRVGDGRTYIEQEWNTGTVSVEICDDREYALVPTQLHHHRVGQEIDPHWRCDLYVREGSEGRYEPQMIVLDVFVRDFDELPELTEA